MVVIHKSHTEVKLDQAQVDLIQGKMLAAVDVNPSGETPPQFLHSKLSQGIFWINCTNESSNVWLMQTISGFGELWEGVELTVVDSKVLPKKPRCSFTSRILQRSPMSYLVSGFKVLS